MSGNIIQLNEQFIHNELKSIVKNSVEETLNALLDAEADKLVQAERYAREQTRKGYRAGHYERSFSTQAGDVTLKVPKLKGLTFESAIIQRYQRRECSVEEALVEMYLAGVSMRRVESITEILWGQKVSAGTISNLNQKCFAQIEEWRSRKLTEKYPYVFVDGIFLKRCWSFPKLKIPHQSHADFCSTDTAGGLDNKKRRYAPRGGVAYRLFLWGFPKGATPPFGTRLCEAKCSVLYALPALP